MIFINKKKCGTIILTITLCLYICQYTNSQTTNTSTTTTPTTTTNSSDNTPTLSPAPTTTDEKGPTWSGCVNPEFPDDPSVITIGDPTYVCLTIGPDGNWARGVSYLRYMFKPKADEYSRFVIPNSYNDIVRSNTLGDISNSALTVHSSSQTSLSFLRTYYNVTEGKVYPFLTAVIDVKDGIVQGIAWDDACVFCSKRECEEITWNFAGVAGVDLGLGEPTKGCYVENTECVKNPTACDIVLYTVWTGTDNDGNPFTSSGSRFSAFPPKEIQNQLLNNLPDIPDINIPFGGEDGDGEDSDGDRM